MAKDGSCLICQKRSPMPLSLCLHYSTAAVNHYLSYCEVEQSHGDVDSNSSLSYETHWLNLDHMLSLSYTATQLCSEDQRGRGSMYTTLSLTMECISHEHGFIGIRKHSTSSYFMLCISDLSCSYQSCYQNHNCLQYHTNSALGTHLYYPVYYHSIHWLPM